MVNTNIFLAVLPSQDNRLIIAKKINTLEAKRSPLVKVQWIHPQDLHITIGYIENVEDTNIRSIALGFAEINKNPPFMASVVEVRLYGNAIVLRIEPNQLLTTFHRKMNQKLVELTAQRYQFLAHKRYDPHLTLGRIRNIHALNALHKDQFVSLVEEQFKNTSFFIQQAALMQRNSERFAGPTFQVLQQYLFAK